MKILGVGSVIEINGKTQTVKRITKEFVDGMARYFVYTECSKYQTTDLIGVVPEVAFAYSESA